MSMVAIFALACCGKQIEFGRFCGSEMYPPTIEKCPFGCPTRFDWKGRPDRVVLRFIDYRGEDLRHER